MPGTSDDFWPKDLRETPDPAPVVLLKEQAALLGRNTGGELEGVVRTSTEGGTVYHSLYIKAGNLGDYLFKLLYLSHPLVVPSDGSIAFTAQSTDGEMPVAIKDVDQFREWLRTELSSDYVRSALGNLMRYIRERQSTAVG